MLLPWVLFIVHTLPAFLCKWLPHSFAVRSIWSWHQCQWMKLHFASWISPPPHLSFAHSLHVKSFLPLNRWHSILVSEWSCILTRIAKTCSACSALVHRLVKCTFVPIVCNVMCCTSAIEERLCWHFDVRYVFHWLFVRAEIEIKHRTFWQTLRIFTAKRVSELRRSLWDDLVIMHRWQKNSKPTKYLMDAS